MSYPLGHMGITMVAGEATFIKPSRNLFVASMLPDLIDKPLYFLTGSTRTIAHTFIFYLAVCLILTVILRNQIAIAYIVGMGMHYVLDLVWQTPETFLWPLFGNSFPAHPFMLNFSNPYIYITEIAGGVILALFAMWLYSRRKLGSFIKAGEL